MDADILDPDTAPGNIVTGRTVEGDTAMARIVREGDIDRHGPGQVAEGRKSADTMKLSATGAIEKHSAGNWLRDSTYWVGSLVTRIVPLGVSRISWVSRILATRITLTAGVVIVGIARHLCCWGKNKTR